MLFPRTMLPAIRAGIGIRVLNTFNSEHIGTKINADEKPTLKAVTCKRGVNIVTVRTVEMFNSAGFLAKLYEIFARHKVSVDVISTSAIEVSSSVDGKIPDALQKELESIGEVTVSQKPQAVISLVGHGIHTEEDHVAPRFLGILDGTKPSMISFPPSATNITIAVDSDRADDVVRRAHEEFFERP